MEEQRKNQSQFPKIVKQAAGKHLPLSIKFDDITPTRVKTRSVVMYLHVFASNTKGQPDGIPGVATPGVPIAAMAVYHDTWRKQDGRWVKDETVLYSSSGGMWPGDPTP